MSAQPTLAPDPRYEGAPRPASPRPLPERAGYRALTAALDLGAVAAAWRLTLHARVLANPLFSRGLSFEQVQALAPPVEAILGLWIVLILWRRPYRAGGWGRLEAGVAAGTIAVVVGFFSQPLGLHLARSFVALFVPAGFVSLAAARALTARLARAVETRWPKTECVALLAAEAEVRRVIEQIRSGGEFANLAGVILPAAPPSDGTVLPLPVLGHTAQLAELINRRGLDRIIVAGERLSPEDLDHCHRICGRMNVTLSRAIAPARSPAQIHYSEAFGLHLLEIRPAAFTRAEQMAKRAIDVSLASLLLAALSPVLLLTAALIRLTSRGPVLHHSVRVGKGGRHFRFLKFRSMYPGADSRVAVEARNEQSGHLFKMREDPRVTPLGRWLRRWSIDELPQLFNVLRGEMSLVGPRPLPAKDLDPDGQSRRFALWSEQRSLVLPGITGLWQVQGRSAVTFERMVDLDLEYIRNWSLRLEFKILRDTPRAVLSGRGAY